MLEADESRGQSALHLRHAPAGRAGSSRQLSDLRDEAHANAQTAVAGRGYGQKRRRAQNQVLQVDHDARRDQSDAAQGQHGNGHGAGLRGRGRIENDHGRSSHRAKDGRAHGGRDQRSVAPNHPNGRSNRLQRDCAGGRDDEISRLDRESLCRFNRQTGAQRRAAVRHLLARSLQRTKRVRARAESRGRIWAQSERAAKAEDSSTSRKIRSRNWKRTDSRNERCGWMRRSMESSSRKWPCAVRWSRRE